MPSPTQPETTPPTSTIAANTACVTCGNNTGLDRIDGTKLNNLFDTVTNCLTSGPLGNILIKGAKGTTGKDPRLGQLVEVTSLRNELGEFKAVFERYIALHSPTNIAETEKPIKISKNVKELNAVIERQQKLIEDLDGKVGKLVEAENARFTSEQKPKFNGKVQKVVDIASKEKTAKFDDSAILAAIKRVDIRVDEVAGLQDNSAKVGLATKEKVDAMEKAVDVLQKGRDLKHTQRVNKEQRSTATNPQAVRPTATTITRVLPAGIRTPYIYYGRALNPDMPVNSTSLTALGDRLRVDLTVPATILAHDSSGYYVNTTQNFLNGGRMHGTWIISNKVTETWLTREEWMALPADESEVWRCYDFLQLEFYRDAKGRKTAKLCPVPELRWS
ncbi:hypothetical protein LTR17_005428 [Elasticomyces elasticus]|nr:hypothetical protein LTR17_005428 [Elasticomyces elasticus]